MKNGDVPLSYSFSDGLYTDRFWFEISITIDSPRKLGQLIWFWRPHIFFKRVGSTTKWVGIPHLLRSSRKVKDEGQDLYATDAADAEKQEEEDKQRFFLASLKLTVRPWK